MFLRNNFYEKKHLQPLTLFPLTSALLQFFDNFVATTSVRRD